MCKAYIQSQSQSVSPLFLPEKRCSSTNRLIWEAAKVEHNWRFRKPASLLCPPLYRMTGKLRELLSSSYVSVCPFENNISLRVFEMHEELHIITLTGFYTRTSHGSKQAQKHINNLAILPSHA